MICAVVAGAVSSAVPMHSYQPGVVIGSRVGLDAFQNGVLGSSVSKFKGSNVIGVSTPVVMLCDVDRLIDAEGGLSNSRYESRISVLKFASVKSALPSVQVIGTMSVAIAYPAFHSLPSHHKATRYVSHRVIQYGKRNSGGSVKGVFPR